MAENFNVSGFVLAPFDSSKKKILISGEYCQEEMKLEVDGLPKDNGPSEMLGRGKIAYIKLVERAIHQIKSGGLRKVVVSRVIPTSTTKSPRQIMESLLQKYNGAFCYWWYHPKIGMWLGATPERLLKYEERKIITTSLAGTLPVGDGEQPHWSNKELEEQQMVTDFISEALKKRVTELEISESQNHRAASVWHLKSEISGTLKSSQDLSEIAEKLHPTPAVGGIPKEGALRFIVDNEGYDRTYYTGYLGTLNFHRKETADLFVNLRCLKYDKGQVKIFVGGGITASSNAEKEWQETQFKSRTILEAL